jgi:hypothetical protein
LPNEDGFEHVVNNTKTKTQAAVDLAISMGGGKVLRVTGGMVKKAISNSAEKAATKSTVANMANTFAQKQAAKTPDKASINRAKQTSAEAKVAQQKANAAKVANSKQAQYPISFAASSLHEKGNNEAQNKVKPKQ